MPLNYNIETFEDSLKFKIRGQEIQLSFIAAGSLCNALAEALLKRKQPLLEKVSYYYWLNKLTKASTINISQEEADALREYLSKVCPKRKTRGGRTRKTISKNTSSVPKPNRYKRVRITEEDRKKKLAAQIKEMRARFNIK